jgi:hypothetical protein
MPRAAVGAYSLVGVAREWTRGLLAPHAHTWASSSRRQHNSWCTPAPCAQSGGRRMTQAAVASVLGCRAAHSLSSPAYAASCRRRGRQPAPGPVYFTQHSATGGPRESQHAGGRCLACPTPSWSLLRCFRRPSPPAAGRHQRPEQCRRGAPKKIWHFRWNEARVACCLWPMCPQPLLQHVPDVKTNPGHLLEAQLPAGGTL